MYGPPRLVFLCCGLAAALAACGPGGRGGGDDDDDVDAGQLPDANPPPPPVVYVHSRDTLYELDADTYQVTRIGAFDTGEDFITDLAVTPDGQVYGISESKLYTVDRTTGHATFRADVPGLDNVGLTFLRDGTLLATDKDGGVREIDTASGAVTEIGEFGNGFTTAGDLVVVNDGTMFALSDHGQGGVSAFDDNWLLEVNPATGRATAIKQIGYGQVFGAAFINGKLLAFTRAGQVVAVDPDTAGDGEVVQTGEIEFWGAGVTPLVPID
jgi:hypothetical protein